MRSRCLLLFVLAAIAGLSAVAPAPSHAFRLPEAFGPITGNPAQNLAELPADDEDYDRARRCDRKVKPGVVRFTHWLQQNAKGVYWGSYRCEKWGKGSASLHAENRAVDWHLNASDAADKRAARDLIRLLLAPDELGTPRALARRLGVQEIIWDCSYWGAGMEQFNRYSPCFSRHGKPRKRVNRTIAHRDHIHFGLSRAGAAARTTFWRAR